MGDTTNIRLLDLQNKMWSDKCILQHIPTDPIPRGINLIYDILQLAKDAAITFCNHGTNDNTYSFNSESSTIKEILNNYKLFKQGLTFLQKYNIRFIEQLILTNGITLIKWQHLKSKVGAKLVAAIDYNKVIFGKEVKKIKIEDKRYLILQHHEEVKSISATTSPSTETWQSPKLNQCTGCSLDENHIVNMYHNQRKQCHIMVHDDKTIKKTKLRINTRRSINTSEHNQSMIVETQLPKGINYIRNLFNSNEITEVLINTYEKNVNEPSEEYSFYTDGSVKQIGTLNTHSGIAWIQTTGAAKAEMMSIFSAILTVPENNSINIYTDSLSFINKYNAMRGIPRKLHLPLVFLRGLSLVPASYGLFSLISAINNIAERDAGGVLELRSTKLDYLLGALWCFVSGIWSYWLADGLMRRWLFYYEVSSAIIRLISLQAINWVITALVVSHYGPDEPTWSWVICGIVLAVSNIIQWLFTSTAKFQKANDADSTRVTTWKEIFKYIMIPLAITSFITMVFLLGQQSNFRYHSNLGRTGRIGYKLNTNLTLSETRSDANVKVIMVIFSSWTERSYSKRQTFRETTLKLIPPNSNRISISYRFVLGDPPSANAQMNMGHKILAESEKYGDIVIVPSSDTYEDLSHKVYKGLEWTTKYTFDYMIKTDDDMFVRMDTVAKELEDLGPGKKYYWRGLGYWNIPPIRNSNNKNSAFDYKLPMFPPFTAGALYILSRDILSLLVTDAPRLFTKNEDQNLGIWLFPYNIKPTHDKRIQQADVCEDDMIAKHFSDSYEPDRSMKEMYENVINNRRMCEGFRQRFCALCYPCWGRENHWRDWNFDCDEVKGITLLNQPGFVIENPLSVVVFDDPVNVTIGSKEDEWIIPGILSQHSSIYSLTEQWYLLHWMCWTTDPSTFQERHYKTIELIWVHTPKAVVFVFSTTLPENFFSDYQKQGYQIYVIRFSKEFLLEKQWFLGQNSKDWLLDWNKWEASPFFFSHLTDYMRYYLLYQYGGMYMDMDALWIRAPPDTKIQFIGSDASDVSSDLEWTLDADGTYLAPGVMRFRKGWRMFKDIAERAFSPTYTTSCFNCVGPRAITLYVKEHRRILERSGLRILPGRILYPHDYVHIDKLLKPNPTASKELRKLEKSSWSIHLFGKMTNDLLIEDDSVISLLFKKFSLDIPHPPALLTSKGKLDYKNRKLGYEFQLEGPKKYRFVSAVAIEEVDKYVGSVNGQFQGLDLIFIRGGSAKASKGTIVAKAKEGKLSFSHHGGEWSETSIMVNYPTKKDINAILNSLLYKPSEELQKKGGKDSIKVEVTYDEEHGGLDIEVVVPVPRHLDSGNINGEI
ncbi:11377_t:CDS:2 [Entrophospora sp. SA101]|nr:11377_t:CDS:2 [Entrophospora sp. SA101]